APCGARCSLPARRQNKVEARRRAAKSAALPVSPRRPGLRLSPLPRFRELACALGGERFPLLRHAFKLLAVLPVAHLIGHFAAGDRMLEGLPAVGHRCLSSACSRAQCRPDYFSRCLCCAGASSSKPIRPQMVHSAPRKGRRAVLGGAILLPPPRFTIAIGSIAGRTRCGGSQFSRGKPIKP